MGGLVLGIETATALGGVALVSADGGLLAETTLLGRESHSERIIPAAGELLDAFAPSPGDLAAVAVSRGPGSFTGLRTGLAAAKGLAFARGIPLFGVSTLEALAANAPPGSGTVSVVLGARRGEVFHARFDAAGDAPKRLTPDALVPLADIAGELQPGSLVLGEPPEPVRKARLSPPLRFAPAHLNHPRAATVALAGLAALRAGRPTELESLLPAYLRGPDADLPGGRDHRGLSCNDKGFRDGLR
ncbi:MAG TPA: tRNA (adenosine(37)-N6)-threonylcarbamoyltransferase complex dimerization subunit type 1 TsaB [bacterium]